MPAAALSTTSSSTQPGSPNQDSIVRASEAAWENSSTIQPHRAGVYANFLDSDDDTSRVRLRVTRRV